MNRIKAYPRRALALAAAPLLATGLAAAAAPASMAATPAQARAADVNPARLPVTFARNDGQAPRAVRYLGQAQGLGIQFTRTGVTLALSRGPARHTPARQRPQQARAQVTLAFRHASAHPQITGTGREPGTVNYMLGSNPARWRTRIPTYARVTYRGLWPGITATFTAANGSLRYWFTLTPGARASEIQLAYTGASGLTVTRSGALAITTAAGVLHDQAPASSQITQGRQAPLRSRYRLLGGTSFGFTLARHAPSAAVTIDPGLDYSTFIGGSCAQDVTSVASDAAGDLYVFGHTCSADFPVTPGAYQTTAAPQPTVLFVTKLNPSGTGLIYSTFIGGPHCAIGAEKIAVDNAGNAYLTGSEINDSTGPGCGNNALPTTPGAYQTTPSPVWIDGGIHGWAAKLNPSGAGLDYATYLPVPPSDDFGSDMGLTPGGQLIVTGNATTDLLPVTPGAYQHTSPGGHVTGYVTELNATGTGLDYATYLGPPITNQILNPASGSVQSCFTTGGVAVDSAGAAYVAEQCTMGFPTTSGAYQADGSGGHDGLLVKLNPTGTRLEYATYFATPQNSDIVRPDAVAVDSSGDAYVTADVQAGEGPATPGAFQQNCTPNTGAPTPYCVWVGGFNPSGTSLEYATFFGGNNAAGEDGPSGIAVDANGNIYITGYSLAEDIPTTPDAAFPQPGNFTEPYYLAVLSKQSGLLYATYFGGGANFGGGFISGVPYIAPNPAGGNVYLDGTTQDPNFPITPGAFQTTYNAQQGQTGWAAKFTLPSLGAATRRGGYKPGARYPARATRSRTGPVTALALGALPKPRN